MGSGLFPELAYKLVLDFVSLVGSLLKLRWRCVNHFVDHGLVEGDDRLFSDSLVAFAEVVKIDCRLLLSLGVVAPEPNSSREVGFLSNGSGNFDEQGNTILRPIFAGLSDHDCVHQNGEQV